MINDFKYIVFDLGGVIEKISPSSVIDAFKSLGMENPETFFSLYRQSSICDDFERGLITGQGFLDYLRPHFISGTSDKEIINAWNANQLGVQPATVSFSN